MRVANTRSKAGDRVNGTNNGVKKGYLEASLLNATEYSTKVVLIDPKLS
jgi:hypothetical protein